MWRAPSTAAEGVRRMWLWNGMRRLLVFVLNLEIPVYMCTVAMVDLAPEMEEWAKRAALAGAASSVP